MKGPLLILGLLVLSSCGASQGSSTSAAPSPYRITSVGRIDSEGEARELVAQVDGVIAQVFVRRGDRVRAGQVLLEVGCQPQAASAQAAKALAQQSAATAQLVRAGPRTEEIQAAQASLRSAEATLLDAQQMLNRANALAERGFVSRRELEARTAQRNAAAGEVDAARARAAQLSNGSRRLEVVASAATATARHNEAAAAQALYAQCKVTSPIDGEVLQILRREGEFSGASQGAPLIVVGDLGKRIVRAEVGERDAARIAIGDKAEIWIDGSSRRWKGSVSEVASVMGRRSARSLDPTDRFDRDIREVIVAIDGTDLPAVVGLRVTAGFLK
ncbi:MAG: HlyD family secretion protein [Novosphingobium sp.]